LLTLSTFQPARFWLKLVADLKMAYMVETDAVFQAPIF
jgi:hypothetical protein